jgi:hypothetical protein
LSIRFAGDFYVNAIRQRRMDGIGSAETIGEAELFAGEVSCAMVFAPVNPRRKTDS